MNIFVLDQDIQRCAEYHADQHVSKMILESTQMLCTVLNQLGIKTPYRSTHTKHPCTLWAGKSLSNWVWLQDLAMALHEEFRYRFDREKQHKSALVAMSLSRPPIPDPGLTPFAQAMPDIYKVTGDAVQAYRNFYIGDKSRFVTWTKRKPPAWYLEGIENHKKN